MFPVELTAPTQVIYEHRKQRGVEINDNGTGISNLKDRCSQPNGRNSRPRYLSPFCGIATRKIAREFFLV